MRARVIGWMWIGALGLGVLGCGRAWAGYGTTNSARFNDWQDVGCRMSAGRAGGPPGAEVGAGGNEAHCGGCAAGMTRWWVDEPYVNLWVADEPLSYATSSGQQMTFRFTHRQRHTLPQPDECLSYYRADGTYARRSQGDRYINQMRTYGMTNACWGHNWLMDIIFWDVQWETNHTEWWWNYPRYGAGYEAWVMRPDGGIWYFKTNVNGQAVLQDAASQARLEPLSGLGYPTVEIPSPGADGLYWGEPATNGFRLVYADGGQDVLSLCWAPAGAGQTTARAFLTQRIDPQGRVTRVGHEYVSFKWGPWPEDIYYAMRVRYVVDPDGRTNTFLYQTNLAKHAWQVAEVDDPYGRKALLKYDLLTGLLTRIVDAAGMTNSFSYLSPSGSGWLASLTTPYGTTSFTYTETREPGTTNGFAERATLVTEPNNAYQLYYYRHQSEGLVGSAGTDVPTVPDSTFDAGTNGGIAGGLHFRNTFHWDRRQAAALPQMFYSQLGGPDPAWSFAYALTTLEAASYNLAWLKHWLVGADGVSITDLVSSQRDPSPDSRGQTVGLRTYYDYANKPSPEVQGDAQPNCIARLLPEGTSQYAQWDYTSAGVPWRQRTTHTPPGGGVGLRTTLYQYAANGVDLLSVSNSAGAYVNLGYNTNHQVRFVTNALGQVSQAGYDPGTRNLAGLTLASGQSATLSYYEAASPPTSTSSLLENITVQPQGLTLQIEDYSNGLPRVVQRSGTGLPSIAVTNFWDGLNRLRGSAFPDSTTSSNTYDRLYLGASKDRLGNWIRFGYDALEHLTSVTDARSNVTTLGWCDCGSLDSITDALTNTTGLFYNNQGLWTNTVFADLSSLSCTRDALGRPVRVADGQDRWLSAGYNNQGLLTAVSNAYGRVWSVVYDELDRPIRVTDANNITVTNQFDLLGRLTNRFWPDGIGEGFGWSTNGLVAYTNRNGKVTRFGRDAAGRLTAVTNANLEVTSVAYNALGQVTDLWDGLNHHTGWGYNEYGRLTSKVDALDREVLHYLYNANGQVTNRWTLQFGNTGYGRDANGNVTNIQYSVSSVSFGYDALNRLQTTVDGVGTTTFGYTTGGQLESEDGPWSNDTLTYGYTQGLRTNLSLNLQPSPLNLSYDYDAAWRLYTLSAPAGQFWYGYNVGQSVSPASIVRTISLPNSAWVTNHYDSLSRLDYTALVNRWGHVLDGYSYTHDALGLRTNIFRDLGLTNSSVAVGYDSIGQLTSWRAREGVSGPLRLNEQLGWAYDAAGNLRYRTNGGLVQTFNCDAVNQLTNVTHNSSMTVSGATPAPAASVTVNGLAAERYGDFTFARTNVPLYEGNNTFSIAAQSIAGTNVAYNLTLTLPASVTLLFDSNGNLTNDGTRSFAYDAENRLASISVEGSWKSGFVYDGLGRRRIERDYAWQGTAWSQTNEVRFVYDGWQPVQERGSNNAVRVTYTRGLDLSGSLAGAGGIGGLLARTESEGSAFYHADGAGNITGLVDGQQTMAARYMYGPFGGLVGKWGSMADVNEMLFSSMPVHRLSGIVGYLGRAYDPNLQRWLQRDPLGEWADTNPYRVNYNNPLSYIDPDGMAPQVVSASYNLTSGATSVGYADSQFGQDYGIGLHGPLGPGGEIALMTGATMVPGVGEAMDLSVLSDPNSRWWELGLAGLSLGANGLTDGVLPNAGGFLKAGRKLCKDATGDIIRIRHYTNAKGLKGIQESGVIRASDQNRVFAESARRKPLSQVEAQNTYGLDPGRGRNYVETDVPADRVRQRYNPETGANELVVEGNVPLQNPTFQRR